MKIPSLITGLVLAGLAASCGQTSVLESVQGDVKDWNTTVQRPLVVPEGGFYRSATPDVTLTVPASGDRVFYTLNGEAPAFTAGGSNDYPDTERMDSGSRFWSSGSLGASWGTYQIRAVTWRADGKTSGETNAVFRVVGDGATVWAQVPPALGTGETLAVDSASDGTHYGAGWFSASGVETGFVIQYNEKGTEARSPAILPPYSRIEGMKVDTSGNLLVVGTLTTAGSYNFGNGVTAAAGTAGAGFLARYSPALRCLGVLIASGASSFHATATYLGGGSPMALVVGEFAGTGPLIIGSVSVSGTHTGTNAVLLKVNLDTMAVASDWLVSTGSADASDWFQAVTANATTGRYHVAGTFDPAGSSIEWNAMPAYGVMGVRNAVVLSGSLSALGTVHWFWTKSLTTANLWLRALAEDSTGNVLVGGDFEGQKTFDSSLTGTSAGTNAFVTILSSGGANLGASGPTGPTTGDSSVRALTVTSKGVYAVGHLAPGTWSWGSVTVVGQGPQTPFLAQIGSGSSVVSWARTPVSTANNLSYSSAGTDPLGENKLIVGGSVVRGTTADFGFGVAVGLAGTGTAPLVTRVFD